MVEGQTDLFMYTLRSGKLTRLTDDLYSEVQANWSPNWFVDEVAWVQSVADTHGWPHGIVGYADFTVDDVRPQLDKLEGFALMRGIRQQLHWHEKPMYRFAPHGDVARDPRVCSGADKKTRFPLPCPLAPYSSSTSFRSVVRDAFASPKSIFVFGSKKSWFEMPAKPGFMLRFMTMQFCA